MIDPDGLNVWNEQRLVGYLWRNSIGQIGFRCDSEWIAGGGFAISRMLALDAGDAAAEEGVAHRFFANLPQAVVSVRAAFEERFGAYPALQRIERLVRKQCERIVQR